MADGPPDEKYQPLALISITLVALVGFSVFFIGFLVAPLAILVFFYVGFAATDRSKRTSSAPPAPAPSAAAGAPAKPEGAGGTSSPPRPVPTAEQRLMQEAAARRAQMEQQDEAVRQSTQAQYPPAHGPGGTEVPPLGPPPGGISIPAPPPVRDAG